MSESWISIQNKPIKEMHKLDLKLCGSKHIRDDNGLTFYSVTGNQQSGKSSYGMRILQEIYEGDVDKILSHIVMSAKEFTEIIDKALTEGYRERCIMWDDMSISGSAATWMKDPKLVMYLSALGDTLAVATKSIIFTSPSSDMTKSFRNYQKYIIQIGMGRQRTERIARGYFIGKSPMHQRFCSQVFEDYYDTRIPFYERYAKKRKDISLESVKNMKEMFKSQEEEPLTEDSFISKMVVNLYESGERNLSAISRNLKKPLGYDIGHQKVGRILDNLGLRNLYQE